MPKFSVAPITAAVFFVFRRSPRRRPLRQFTIGEVESILRNNGYSAIEQISDRLLAISINGTKYGVFVDDAGDIQGYYGLNASGVTLEVINDWNRNKRFSRAYLDDVNDPVLEADLDAAEGVTREQVAWFIKLFIQSSDQFRDHIVENR